jgi:hypothetical protein
MNLLLAFSALVTGLLTVIWNSKDRRFDGIIIVRIKPEVKNDSVLGISFRNHFFTFISQIFNVSVIVALPSVKILPITICFACKDIVRLIEPISWNKAWRVIKTAQFFFSYKGI